MIHSRRVVAIFFFIGAFLELNAGAVIASGSVDGESSLDPWTLEGELMAEGGEEVVVARSGLPCPDIHAEIDNYNAAPTSASGTPPQEVIELTWPLNEEEIALLRSFVDDRWSFQEIEDCTTMHHDGYKPATRWLVEAIEDAEPMVAITAEGETTCDYGEVLISDAHYYFSPFGDGWISGFGKNWEEVFGLVEGFEIRGEVELYCLEIAAETIDAVKISEAVPTVQVNHDPLTDGLTGIDTWLWYDFDRPGAVSELTLTETIDAYGRLWTLDAFAWIDWIGWDVDCVSDCDHRGMLVNYDASGIDHIIDFADTTHAPAPSYEGGTNREDEAAAIHVYEAKGDYTLSTVTVWRGYYLFNDLTTLYDPVVVADSVPYNVIEIRSVLGDSDDG